MQDTIISDDTNYRSHSVGQIPFDPATSEGLVNVQASEVGVRPIAHGLFQDVDTVVQVAAVHDAVRPNGATAERIVSERLRRAW
jgi:hypothetical protein